ncbi:DUF559 domain-containing protein [Phytohabitans sp. ZYX-F-186]|uniref:DUF559 domain-containing protein n=1 Tax=Phytohabitans maris TaxID=3071409 RepID=A0ABU0ZAE6_9ACTN|nr:DUF559 domain-containing protein [Phytohabitans sp. ZYX-F-186]MDQ7903302.1 DUF559 domain-containing protein [Phytohabitans sp. ZYX-F-186]
MVRLPRVPAQLRYSPFRGRDAVAAGLVTRRMLAGPAWQPMLPDVYVHVDAFQRADHGTWCDAAALLLPEGGAIGGLSAAYLWGAGLVDAHEPVTMVLPRAIRPKPHPRLRIVRSNLPPDDVARLDGLAVTTPLRTAFDVARSLPRVEAVVAVDALLGKQMVTLPKLIDYAAGRSRWRGMPRLREVLALAEPLTESPMESRLRLLIVDAGLPRPVAQHEIFNSKGRLLGRADLAYPGWRIAIEYEGDHHRERDRFRQDVHRLNALRAAGWLVLRFTADDVLRHPDRTARQVAHAIRERR